MVTRQPYLYKLHIYIKDKAGNTIDGYYRRIGIRSIEFKGKDGFWLNGKPYPYPLMGANRHQDFAVIGNALPNSLHWRDAKKLRDAGMRVIRNAHYPQDPAFMDACDELGLFVIVNTPDGNSGMISRSLLKECIVISAIWFAATATTPVYGCGSRF